MEISGATYFIFNILITLISVESNDQEIRNEQNITIDPNGYIFFCLCMGRFGNQLEHFLGGLAFAKEINRTLVLPPFRTYKNIPFDDWFKLEKISSYHRVILAEDFMRNIAPIIWPIENRPGFCYVLPNSDQKSCEIKMGNPFSNFWDELNVNFTQIIPYSISYYEPEKWPVQFPPDKYPVLALKGAPASFPMWQSHVPLQSYLHFSDHVLEEVENMKKKYLHGSDDYVGVHLRNGQDWVSTCELVGTAPKLMSSYQCLGFGPKKTLTMEMCLPSVTTVVQMTKRIVEKEQVQFLLIATDKDPLIKYFNSAMPHVQVIHIDPWLPLMDIVLLTDSKHFIGNCVSSFSAFVWRHRMYHKKGPSSHFGVN